MENYQKIEKIGEGVLKYTRAFNCTVAEYPQAHTVSSTKPATYKTAVESLRSRRFDSKPKMRVYQAQPFGRSPSSKR